jgi:hypothetical protein
LVVAGDSVCQAYVRQKDVKSWSLT